METTNISVFPKIYNTIRQRNLLTDIDSMFVNATIFAFHFGGKRALDNNRVIPLVYIDPRPAGHRFSRMQLNNNVK